MSPMGGTLAAGTEAVTTLRALVSMLGAGGPDGSEYLPEAEQVPHLMALIEAEASAAGLENLYSGLRDGTYDYRNVPGHLAVTGNGWHDRNDTAAALVAAALDRAQDELAALRGTSGGTR